MDCSTLIPEDRDLVNCNSRVDVIIVVDGSASLGEVGWAWTMNATGKLITALSGGAADVHVALQVYSGPEDWDTYERCTGSGPKVTGAPEGELDMGKDCGITWVSHLTNDTKSLQSGLSKSVEWPRESTLTAVALGQAESELVRGRADANS